MSIRAYGRLLAFLLAAATARAQTDAENEPPYEQLGLTDAVAPAHLEAETHRSGSGASSWITSAAQVAVNQLLDIKREPDGAIEVRPADTGARAISLPLSTTYLRWLDADLFNGRRLPQITVDVERNLDNDNLSVRSWSIAVPGFPLSFREEYDDEGYWSSMLLWQMDW